MREPVNKTPCTETPHGEAYEYASPFDTPIGYVKVGGLDSIGFLLYNIE